MDELIISAIGCATPFGNTPEEITNALYKPDSFIKTQLNPRKVDLVDIESIDRSFLLLETAFETTFKQIDFKKFSADKTAVFISSSKGAMASHELSGWSPLITPPDRAGLHICGKYGLKGTLFCITAACATGIFALDAAIGHIKLGNANNAIVAVTESALTPLVLAGFRNMGVLSSATKPEGFIPAEGAVVLTVEKLSAATLDRLRYTNVIATNCTTSPHHPVRFDEKGDAIASCISKCIAKSGLTKSDIGAICLHGTGTENNDRSEAKAIKTVFGDYTVPCFGIKAAIGHLLGSSALVEIAVCTEALKRREIPPTAFLYSRKPQMLKKPAILSLNFGFGGHIGAVILSDKADPK